MVVGLVLVGLLARLLVRRTEWDAVAPTPVVHRRRAGQIVRAALTVYRRDPLVFVAFGLIYIPAAIVTGALSALIELVPLVGSQNGLLLLGVVNGCLAAWFAGRGIACRLRGARFAPAALWVLSLTPLLAALVGESASLSTIDVHLAFDAVDGPTGLGGALLIVMARHVFPLLPFLCGLGSAGLVRSDGVETVRFWVAIAAVLVGEGAVALGVLSLSGAVASQSLAVGLLVRVAGEISVVFLCGAGLTVLWCRGPPK